MENVTQMGRLVSITLNLYSIIFKVILSNFGLDTPLYDCPDNVLLWDDTRDRQTLGRQSWLAGFQVSSVG